MQFYRHPPYNGHCCDPWNFIMVQQDCSKEAIHRCYYCKQVTIPTAYYAICERDSVGNITSKYFILDREISKEEFDQYSELDESINRQAHEYKDIVLDLEREKS